MRVRGRAPGEPLPWEPDHKLAQVPLRGNQAWRHLVYVGIFSLESVFEVLSRVFVPDEESFDERPGGESALAAFVVSGEGRPLIGSEVLSSCAWATGRALDPGPGKPGWLIGFECAKDAFSARFADLVAPEPDDERAEELRQLGHEVGRPIGREVLTECLDSAAETAQVGSALSHTKIRIHSHMVAKRTADNADGHDFLNSFIADDLAMVAEQAGSGKVGATLREYLRPNSELDPTRRVDVRERLGAVLEATAPRCVPLGRWPSKPEHPLALTQQLAVNNVLQMLDSGAGMFAVNGPPGTGKTTMLRDLVAALVVERARRLAELTDPRNAFTEQPCRWKTSDGHPRVVHLWKPEFTGFEMVVASANNGAVENVTNEIPAQEAIDEYWRADATQLDYFPDIASALLATDRDDRESDEEGSINAAVTGWALVAARLGKKSHCRRFVNGFWWLNETRSAPGDSEDRPGASALPDGERCRLGLRAILKEYQQLPAPQRSWPESVAAFRQALEKASAIQAARQGTYDALIQQPYTEHELRAAQEALTAAQQQVAVSRAQITEVERAAQGWKDERVRSVQSRTEHRQFRPGFLEWLTSRGKAMREWRQRDQVSAAQVAEAEQALHRAHGELARLTREVELATQAAAHREERMRRCERERNAIQAELDQAQAALRRQFPDPGWWEDRSRRELTALWTDQEWNRARTELFLAALRLHKAFLEHTPKEMRQSLDAAADILAGRAPREVSEAAALAAWRALFFVIPVVSTTFASFARLFSHLGQDALGWTRRSGLVPR